MIDVKVTVRRLDGTTETRIFKATDAQYRAYLAAARGNADVRRRIDKAMADAGRGTIISIGTVGEADVMIADPRGERRMPTERELERRYGEDWSGNRRYWDDHDSYISSGYWPRER